MRLLIVGTLKGQSHDRHQDRDGQRRFGKNQRQHRTGEAAAAARAPTCCWSTSPWTSATW